MSVVVEKCLVCKWLFGATEKDNLGTLEIRGRRLRVVLCDRCRGQLEAAQDRARKEAQS